MPQYLGRSSSNTPFFNFIESLAAWDCCVQEQRMQWARLVYQYEAYAWQREMVLVTT
jgi:hypothetical protein